jgi:rod shape-determining protein MreD
MGIYVDALLLVAVYAAWHAPDKGPVAAWLCGWAKDLFSGDPLGLNALVFLCVGLFLVRAGRVFSRRIVHTVVLVAFAAAAASNLFLGVRACLLSGGSPADYLQRGFVATVATSLAAPLLFWVADRLRVPDRFSLARRRYV